MNTAERRERRNAPVLDSARLGRAIQELEMFFDPRAWREYSLPAGFGISYAYNVAQWHLFIAEYRRMRQEVMTLRQQYRSVFSLWESEVRRGHKQPKLYCRKRLQPIIRFITNSK